MSSAAVSPRAAGGETALAVLYFAAYLGYLFVHQEGELLHWLTLVLVPLAGIALVGRYPSAGALVGSIGLDAVTAARGLPLAALLGIAFQGLQLLNARQRADLMEALEAPFGFVLPLVAFALLVGTVATTEEVFFRGILQRRLAETLRSESAANGVIGGLALGLVYWRSHHNLIAAIGLHACIDLIPATRLVHGLFTPTS